MRLLLVISLSISGVALAQSGGVWTGYVGGWKPDPVPYAQPLGRPLSPLLRQRPQVVVVPYAVSTGFAVRQDAQPSAAELDVERRRAWDAEQARLAQQAQFDAERRLASEREALLQQQLENERRLAAEREALAQERLRLEREAVARAAVPPTPPPAPVAPRPDEPRTPGNDIYRWTDGDGVVHYSTTVPDSAKALAKKVGGSRP